MINYDSKFDFNKCKNDNKFDGLSLSSKVDYLKEFHDELVNLNKISYV